MLEATCDQCGKNQSQIWENDLEVSVESFLLSQGGELEGNQYHCLDCVYKNNEEAEYEE